jgi:hypothetical protein
MAKETGWDFVLGECVDGGLDFLDFITDDVSAQL